MKTHEAELIAVCGNASQFPDSTLPEIAMIGKSNVGKSSLINALCSRKALARTSQSPGKTRTINFYEIDRICCLVDLPGYGYAKVSQKEQQKWGQLIERYLKKRTQLKKVILLIDIRHEPGTGDQQMYEWLVYYGFVPVIAATKMDKIKKSQLQKQVAVIADTLGIEDRDSIIPVSAVTKDGMDELWQQILNV